MKKPPLTQRPSPLGFSTKRLTQSPVELESAEASRGLNRRHRGTPVLLLVKFDEVAHVYVADAVAVGHAEALTFDVLANAQQTSAGHRIGPVSTTVTFQGSA